MKNTEALSCQTNCGHSDQEHQAFDEGFESGKNRPDERCPYLNELKEIWMIGHSVGLIVRNVPQQETFINELPNKEALIILMSLYVQIERFERWNCAEAPDNHSFAWHGCNILRNAMEWLLFGEIKLFDAYQPFYTR